MAEVVPIQQDYADEERRERLQYQQENNAVLKSIVWALCILVSAGMWGLALTVMTWSKPLYRWVAEGPWYGFALIASIGLTLICGLLAIWNQRK